VKRPLGLKIYGTLFLIYGLYISSYAVVRLTIPAAKSVIFPPSEFLIGGLIGLVALVNGIGILRLKRWGYWLTLFGNGIMLLFIVMLIRGLVASGGADGWGWVTLANSSVWCGLIFWYFLRPLVRAQFQLNVSTEFLANMLKKALYGLLVSIPIVLVLANIRASHDLNYDTSVAQEWKRAYENLSKLDNGANDYLEAVELFIEAPDADIERETAYLIQTEWRYPDPRVVSWIEANTPAVEKIQQGNAKPARLVPRVEQPDLEALPAATANALLTVLIARGKRAEAGGDIPSALESYMDAVRFGYGLEEMGRNAAHMVRRVVFRNLGLEAIRKIAPKIEDSEIVTANLRELASLEKSAIPLSEVAKGELLQTRRALDEWYKTFEGYGAEADEHDPVLARLSDRFRSGNLFWRWYLGKQRALLYAMRLHKRIIKMADLPYPTFIERAQRLTETVDPTRRGAQEVESLVHPTGSAFAKTVVRHALWASAFFAQGQADERATRVALELQLYRLAHGNYPQGLDSMKTGQGFAVPADPFSGGPFHYLLWPDGCTLYSVGPDLKDDGGILDYGKELEKEHELGGDLPYSLIPSAFGFATYESPHFHIISPLAENIVQFLEKNLEAYYQNMTPRFFPKGFERRLVVTLLEQQSTTRELYGLSDPGYGYRQNGITSPCGEQPAVYAYRIGESPGEGLGNIFRQITHHLIALNFRDAPGWFETGLAAFLSERTRIVRGELTVGRPNQLREYALRDAIESGTAIDVGQLMSLSDWGFYETKYGGSVMRALFYWLYSQGKLEAFMSAAPAEGYDIATLERVTGQPVGAINESLLNFIKTHCYPAAYLHDALNTKDPAIKRESLQKAIEIQPSYWPAQHVFAGYLMDEEEDFDRARAVLQPLLEQNESLYDRMLALQSMGESYLSECKYSKALEYFLPAYADAEYHEWKHEIAYSTAQSYRYLGDRTQARQWYATFLHDQVWLPETPSWITFATRYTRTYTLHPPAVVAQPMLAIAELVDPARQSREDTAIEHYRLGNKYYEEGPKQDLERARHHFRRAITLYPADDFGPVLLADAYYWLAKILETEDKNYAGALALWQAAITLDPQNPWPYDEAGRMLLQLGRGPEANAYFKEFIKAVPDGPQADWIRIWVAGAKEAASTPE